MMQRPGKSFELTTGVDRLDGTLGDDTFVATEKTLTGVDRIDGGEGMDTLELSSSGSDDDVNIASGASVMHVETLTVDSGGDFEADLSGWEGLTDVVLSDVAGDVELDAGGADVSSKSLEGDTVEIMNAAMVNLEDVSESTQVNIFGADTTTSVMVEGGKGVEVGKSTAHSETVKRVTLDGVRDGMGDDGKRYGANTAAKEAADGKAAVAAVNNKDSVPVHIYSKAIESVDLRNTNTTLLVENAARDMTELTAMVDRFGNTANGHGKLCLKGIEDLMIEVKGDSNIRLASDQIKTVAVSGAGDLTLDVTKFAPAVAEKAADVKPSETLESIDASEASGAVKIAALNKSVMSYMGSMGKDDVSVTAFNAKGLTANLGAGDDMFTVANVKAGKSRIDGGAGMDTLVLKEKTGANLKGAGDAYTGFETITLDAGGGSGTYDVKELDIDNLKVTGGTGAGGVVFKNLMSGTDLAVSSKKPGSTTNKATATTAVVSYMLEDGDDDSLMLHLHSDGGTKDEKGDFGVKVAQDKMKLNLTLDKDIEELVVHSTAKVTSTVAAASRPKAGDYVNRVVVQKDDGIEEIKVTGDARTFISVIVEAGTALTYDKAGLKSLELVDARESSGGLVLLKGESSGTLTVEGSPVDDWVIANLNTGESIKTELKGHNGDDVLTGNRGEDKLTGGAGGDVLIGDAAIILAIRGQSDIGLEFSRYADADYAVSADTAKDTFIYTDKSDSQIKFGADGNPKSGFDRIFGFDIGEDRISLSGVVDLTGGMHFISNGGELSLKALMDAKSLDNAFESDPGGQSFRQKHVITIVRTKESADFRVIGNSIKPSETLTGIAADTTAVNVSWVLVDVDGDGDFDANADMAIALINVDGASFTSINNFSGSDFI